MTAVRLAVLYGDKCWLMMKRQIDKIMAMEMSILRFSCNVTMKILNKKNGLRKSKDCSNRRKKMNVSFKMV